MNHSSTDAASPACPLAGIRRRFAHVSERARGWALLLALIAAGALPTSRLAADPTIRPQPGGKRLLFFDGESVRPEPGGRRLLFIDGDSIRTEPGGKRLFFIDGNSIRPEPGGLRLAFLDPDDGNLRRSPGGRILLNYRHPDICPTAAEKRIFFVDGDRLTAQQLVAALHLLKPEVFQLTSGETDALKKEREEAAKEDEAAAAADPVAGPWKIVSGSGPVARIDGGALTVGAGAGGTYPITIDHSAKGGPVWTGAAALGEIQRDRYLFAAYGTPKTIALCVYAIKGGTLEGRWYPWYITGEAKHVGTESLQGPEGATGEFKITAAQSPTTGAAYTGTVTIKPAGIVGAPDDALPVHVSWKLGEVSVHGIGVKTRNALYVAAGAGPDVHFAVYAVKSGTLSGDWYRLGSTEKGISAALR